jgi:hypothetical protein
MAIAKPISDQQLQVNRIFQKRHEITIAGINTIWGQIENSDRDVDGYRNRVIRD